MISDEKYMQIAIDLARKYSNISFPNPPVACLIVEYTGNYKNDVIVGFGYTSEGGRPHAENKAISNVEFNKKKKYICYSTLEPCCHFGRSESCVSVIINTPINEVVFSLTDPDKRVNGNGMKALIQAGKKIRFGVLKEKAIKLYEGYFLNRIKKRPKVTLKIATSLDGNISFNSLNKPITNDLSRKYVQNLRSENDAILIGGNTLRQDDSKLNCRIQGLKKYSPMRFILSDRLDFNKRFKVFKIKESKTIIFKKSFEKKKTEQKFNNVFVEYLTKKNCNLNYIIKKIATFGVSNLIVEGGAQIFGNFLKYGFCDELLIFRSNFFIGQKGLNAIRAEENFFSDKNKFILQELKYFNDDHLEIFNSNNHIKFINSVLKKY